MAKKIIPGDRIVEEEEESDSSGSSILSPESGMESPGPSIQSPLHTLSYGKAKSGKPKKVAQPPYGVVFLP